MPPERPITPSSVPHLDILLTDDGSRTLRDRLLNETYHSGCGALSECLHVYLRNSGIEQKLQRAADHARPVRVLEIGFGTGMGWLLTAMAAEVYQHPLVYVSLEKQLLPAEVLAMIDTASAVDVAVAKGWLSPEFARLREIEQRWLAFRSRLSSGSGALAWLVSEHNGLQLILGDALEILSHTRAEDPVSLGVAASLDGLTALDEPLDAIYFDAFSPATNPELWQAELFKNLKDRLAPDGLLVSYCVSGAVRRSLESAGYEVTRRPGPPGGKREVLVSRARKGV
ncbi:MAG: tRNA (5-methylaminomethyl-2-thiouridine)(34)-methyltransferase MnmD [Pirellulaceae bacterium]|nr:tRNA (5-methylaminomethyl-2-thiouridine)(34)-methyltransferase MnmD [Pirellulaceae bacterium]